MKKNDLKCCGNRDNRSRSPYGVGNALLGFKEKCAIDPAKTLSSDSSCKNWNPDNKSLKERFKIFNA